MKRSTKRRVAIAAVAATVLYATFLGWFFWMMSQPPAEFGRLMTNFPMPLMAVLPFERMWNVARGGSLQPGDLAPDFELSTYPPDGSVRLSDFRGKSPVVLVFGSYT